MIANYLSAIKANFVLYNMSYSLLEHPRIKYFQKAMRISRPLAVISHNVIDLHMLERISKACDHLNYWIRVCCAAAVVEIPLYTR